MSERDEFEAWAKADGYQIDRVPSQPSLYNWASTQCCWEAWQAARATPPQAVPALTDEQIEAVREMAMEDAKASGMVKEGYVHAYVRAVINRANAILAAPQPSQEQSARQKYQD